MQVGSLGSKFAVISLASGCPAGFPNRHFGGSVLAAGVAQLLTAADNPRVKSWLKRHPRFHVHFIPTSSSWLNLIERWFREITDKRIRRGTFRNVEQLIAAIEAFIQEHNDSPQAFTWTAKADDILAKVRRAREVLDKTPSA
jgi:hypothetical protein